MAKIVGSTPLIGSKELVLRHLRENAGGIRLDLLVTKTGYPLPTVRRTIQELRLAGYIIPVAVGEARLLPSATDPELTNEARGVGQTAQPLQS